MTRQLARAALSGERVTVTYTHRDASIQIRTGVVAMVPGTAGAYTLTDRDGLIHRFKASQVWSVSAGFEPEPLPEHFKTSSKGTRA